MQTSLTAAERAVAEQSEAQLEIIDEIVDIDEEANDRLFFGMKCAGLPDEPECMWNDIATVYEDFPDLALGFFLRSANTCFSEKINVRFISSDRLILSTGITSHREVWPLTPPDTHAYRSALASGTVCQMISAHHFPSPTVL